MLLASKTFELGTGIRINEKTKITIFRMFANLAYRHARDDYDGIYTRPDHDPLLGSAPLGLSLRVLRGSNRSIREGGLHPTYNS